MKKEHVTRKEVGRCMDAKKIWMNMVIYFVIYLICLFGSIVLLLFKNPTWGLILAVIFSMIGAFMIIYQCVRFVRLMNGADKFPCYVVKLDKVNYYMSRKIPVFAAAIPTDMGTKVVETNAIYKNKDIEKIVNHRAKVLYDAKKNRIYVITLVD